MTAEHVAQLASVTAAVISPDGAQIAYTRSSPRHPGRDDDGAGWTTLHVVDATGDGRLYAGADLSPAGVRWLADGSALALLGSTAEGRTVFLVPADGGAPYPALDPVASVADFDVAPGGARVAYLAPEPEADAAEALRKKGFDVEVYEEQLRPHRVWIDQLGALPSSWERPPEPDEAEEPQPLPVDGHVSGVSWSPDGTRLLLATAPTPLVDDSLMRRTLRVVDAQTGAELLHVDHHAKLGAFRWAPDGAHIAMITGEDRHDPSAGRLHVVEVATGARIDLLPGYEGEVDDLAWRDSDTVVFLGAEGCERVLAEVDLDGARRDLVAAGQGIWTALDLAPSGPAAVVGHTPAHPREVFRLDGTAITRLTDSNPWLADVPFGRQEVVRWPARDGLEIEGVLVHPIGVEEGVRTPLILSVHGGPESHVPNGFVTSYSTPGQMAAALGVAVLYPNYRGSTGRGVAFSKLDQGDQAGPEFDDLVDGITYLDEQGLIDPSRVGITGRSYGGFATAWAATRLTEHFAAGVMGVGISEQISKFGTTDIPNEMHDVHARSWPWEDWDLFRDRSPVTWAPQSKTPLLIAHGKEDTRVHPSQSLTMYRYLKEAGQAPVRLVLYPGEAHGTNGAAARYDYTLRMMQWLMHYLAGPGGDPPPWELQYGLEVSPPAEEG